MKQNSKVQIDEERMIRAFRALTAIDSPSFGEREMADALTERLQELGFTMQEDRAWERALASDGNAQKNNGRKASCHAGNLYGFRKGTIAGAPILFSSHMDTVEPAFGKKAILDPDGTIHSDGTTVLGADDVAGLVEILEGIRAVLESGLPHRDIEVLFPIAEELYTEGTRAMGTDGFAHIQAKEAYVPDMSGAPGVAANRAPSLISFRIQVKGKAAHAGFEPENGIHAIQAAAEAVSRLSLGHVDADTTCNIGTIQGGTGTNIVPEECTAEGEIRSYVHQKALDCLNQVFRIFQETAENSGATVETGYTIHLHAYETAADSIPARRFQRVCGKLGLRGELVPTFGGSDNNTFAEHGIEGLVLSCGMYNAHSVKEYTRTKDLVAGAELIAGLILDTD